eukprot:GGOE01003773.1.p1 GENE.GGOE01003773.1~~GGOE01003773.1.p1  ORF type:complete len:419 (-),score=107.86 GGOE01003773.1:502-1758(-)
MVENWSVDAVCKWLELQGFGKYKSKFLANAVDGACLLELTPADIKAELEIPVLQDRKELWIALQRLKGDVPAAPVAAVPSPTLSGQSPSPSPGPGAGALVGRGSPLLSTGSYSPPAVTRTSITRTPEGVSIHTTTTSTYSSAIESRPGSRSPSMRSLDRIDLLDGKCGRCGRLVGSAFVKAFGRMWHEDCFTCTACGLPIRDAKYAKKAEAPYHADCLAQEQGDFCAKCLRTILGTVTTALDRKWHMECFTCGRCGRPIIDKCFAAIGDVPYHSACDPVLSGTSTPPASSPLAQGPQSTGQVCAGCSSVIESGMTTMALGKVWHSECFCCAKCGRPIREDKFKTDRGTPFHINCKLAENSIFCRGCHKEIHGGDIVNAMDEVWHPECFKCNRCGLRIMSEKFARDGLWPIHTHCKVVV